MKTKDSKLKVKNAFSFVMAGAVAGITSVALALPVVQQNSVTMVQEGGTVKVDYTLQDEAGIVTVDIQTNGVSIGGAHLTHMSGDVNCFVQPGDRSFTWKPYKSWADNLATNATAVVSAWSTNCPPDYMAVSLVVPNCVRYYPNADAVPFGVDNDLYKTEMFLLRKIPAANVEWRMGTPAKEVGRGTLGEDGHLVTLSDDYYIGVYPVTQRQYELIDNARPSYFIADYATRPVEQVPYMFTRGEIKDNYAWPKDGHAVGPKSIFGKLRAHVGMQGFDLPTEAQWEFACRAGCGSALYTGEELNDATVSSNLNAIARYWDNGGNLSGNKKTNPDQRCSTDYCTAKVGSYGANAWGLYDMLGNVAEWCLDAYAKDLTNVDPNFGPDDSASKNRIARGGSWIGDANVCRSGGRDYFNYETPKSNVGFRIACTAVVNR